MRLWPAAGLLEVDPREAELPPAICEAGCEGVTGTIHAALDELRATYLDQRDKGDRFERLIHAYLTNDPEWTARFTDVWLWSDWPGRNGRPDTGIDLVAGNRDGGGLTARLHCVRPRGAGRLRRLPVAPVAGGRRQGRDRRDRGAASMLVIEVC